MKWFILCITILCVSCEPRSAGEAGNKSIAEETRAYGKVLIFDTSAIHFVDTSAVVRRIGSGFDWAEGPVWAESINALLFSDVLQNKVYKWTEADSIQLFLTPSGYTDSSYRDGENGSNGLTIDREGRLLLCQSGNRHVARMDAPMNNAAPTFTILSDGYNGKKFNSPNDIVVSSKHTIFFTDPVYGLPDHADDPSREIRFEGVYKIDSLGKTSLLIDSILRPNGIALSPEETTLYVASSDANKPCWYAYQLDESQQIKSGGIFVDGMPLKKSASVHQGPDGMKVDANGNLFCAGPDGVQIFSPTGKRLALIQIYKRRTSNCAFNTKKDILYITADDAVFAVKVK